MEKIIAIIKDLHPEFDFDESEDFIEDGFLDSFDVVTLVSELDDAYGISIDGLDIVPEYFVSYESIAQIVTKNGGQL